MASQVAVIKALVKSLVESGATSSTGTAALNTFLRSVNIDNYNTLIDKFASAYKAYGSNKLQDFLEEACGVRRNNSDTGAITGKDAGGTAIKTKESIIPESSTAKELTDSEYKSFTKNGLTVNITYDEPSSVGSAYNYEVENYINKQKLVVKKLYNWWIPEALDLINQSLGVNFTDGRANTTELNIEFVDSYTPISIAVSNDMGYASEMILTISMSYLSGLTEDDKNGVLKDSNGNEYTYSYRDIKYMDVYMTDALANLALRANIPYFYNLPSTMQSALGHIVAGYDDTNYVGAYSYYDMKYDVESYAATSYAMLRWLAKNYADQFTDEDAGGNSSTGTTSGGSSTDTVTSGGGTDTTSSGGGTSTQTGGGSGTTTQSGSNNDDDGDGLIFNNKKTAVTITADYENDAFDANDYDNLVNINASKATYDLEITGNENNNSIVGGKGDDTLNGGDGNDTLTGGKGEDVFVYKRYDGDDVITDYKPGEDKIEIAEGSITDIKYKGDDVIFTIGRNTLTVKNNNGNEITIIDENGDETTQTYIDNKKEAVLPLGAKYNSSKTTLTLSKKFKDDEIDLTDYADTVKTITATAVKNELTITANENNNVIKVGKKATTVYGGAGNDQITGGKGADALYGEEDDDLLKGGSGADTLSGGDGNDTLTGGAGKDVFIYDGNGADVITDYKTGQDSICLADNIEIASVTVKGKNVTFNFGDTATLMIKNAKNKKITLVDEDGEVIDTVKYKKSVVLVDDDDERDFVEASDYWFAKDDNVAVDSLDNIITQTTCSNSALDMTDLTTDYLSINKTYNKTFITQTKDK